MATKETIARTDVTVKFITEPDDVYHGQAQENLSSHQLGAFRKSPWLYRKKKLGLIGNVDRPAYAVGRAVHTMVLEGQEAFDELYTHGGPINDKTGKPYGPTSGVYKDWVTSQGRTVLNETNFQLVKDVAEGVAQNAKATELLDNGVPERVIRIVYCGVPCQTRMDWFNPRKGLVDLKTCDNLTYMEHDARRYDYVNQFAFYHAILHELTGIKYPVFMIGVEKKEPFRCGVWRVNEGILAEARKENEAAIEEIKKCEARGAWPTGYEKVRDFDWK